MNLSDAVGLFEMVMDLRLRSFEGEVRLLLLEGLSPEATARALRLAKQIRELADCLTNAQSTDQASSPCNSDVARLIRCVHRELATALKEDSPARANRGPRSLTTSQSLGPFRQSSRPANKRTAPGGSGK